MSYWTKKEEALLVKHYGRVSNDEMRLLIPDRSYSAINSKANEMRENGFDIPHTDRSRYFFKKPEVDIILKHYGRKPIEEILEMLPGRDVRAIQLKVGNLRVAGYDIPKYQPGPADIIEKPFKIWVRVGNREILRTPVGRTLEHAKERVLEHFKKHTNEVVIIDGPSREYTRQINNRQREVLRIEF